MDVKQRYLNGDIYSFENVNKIVPRKTELGLLMQRKIQIKKNLFGIKSKLFRHLLSYGYKFPSLAAENKQPIRALRVRTRSTVTSKPPKITKIDRSLTEKSSEWKLPPNIYFRLGDFKRKQMGKKGPYQCFTVERDDKTVRNHHAPKRVDECCETDFYELPSQIASDGIKPYNLHKNKFLKSKRFDRVNVSACVTPPPTKYFPQNFTINAGVKFDAGKASKIIEVDPVFYYPQTTVPEREMTFSKEPFPRPAPGRYNPHDITCRCHLTTRDKRCPGTIPGEGHSHVFNSTAFRLVHPVRVSANHGWKKQSLDDFSLSSNYRRQTQSEPISFRPKKALSTEDLPDHVDREIRYNTMIKKKNLFSVKTGRPVGFLSASPRFGDTIEKPIKLYSKPRSLLQPEETKAKPDIKQSGCKKLSQQRLEELATPKHALPKCRSEKIQVYAKLPPPLTSAAKENILETVESPSAFSGINMENLREKSSAAKKDSTKKNGERSDVGKENVE